MRTLGYSAIDEILNGIEQKYRCLTPNSEIEFQRASASLPGGETRSVTTYAPYPVCIRSGQGAYLTDADGRQYLDLVCNYTALIHGHAWPAAVEAASKALANGGVFASPHLLQMELAELLCERLGLERIRFTNSGTEAAILAARLSRHATGRRRLVLFDGAYHGSAPPFLFDNDPEVTIVPFNDLPALNDALGDDVAAVFCEPFLGAGGVILPVSGFLAAAQASAHQVGALFVLDEVQSLRLESGGAQGAFGLAPDITLLGKIIGGGLPIGAIAGRADLLALTASAKGGSLLHAGTFNGHPAAAAAGVATLEALLPESIDKLNTASEQLARRICRAADTAGIPMTVTVAGSIMNIHFMRNAPVNAQQVRKTDNRWLRALHLALILEGIYTTPRGLICLSTAHKPHDLSTVADAYESALAQLKL